MTDPVLQAALAQPSIFMFGAIKIELPDHTIRVLDGSGQLVIAGETYVGTDEIFGTLESIGTHSETIGDEAPEMEFGFLPPDASSAAELASGLMQGCPVTVMIGVYDPTSNLIIGVPEVPFYGEVDVPTYDASKGARSVAFTVVTVFERLFEVREGERASDGWHQSIWPGELGLEFVTGTSKNLYWGTKIPVGAQIGRSTPRQMWEAPL